MLVTIFMDTWTHVIVVLSATVSCGIYSNKCPSKFGAANSGVCLSVARLSRRVNRRNIQPPGNTVHLGMEERTDLGLVVGGEYSGVIRIFS